METAALSATRYLPQCPSCGTFVPVVLFESSFYDFATFRGTGTGSLYRLDRTRLAYELITEEDALVLARQWESAAGGELVRAQDAVQCQRCSKTFPLARDSLLAPAEDVVVQAVELPTV